MLLNRCYVVIEIFMLIRLPLWSFLKHITGKFVDVKSCTNQEGFVELIPLIVCDVVEPKAACTLANFLRQTIFARVDEKIVSNFLCYKRLC